MTSQFKGGKAQDSCLGQKHDLLPLPQRGQTLMADTTAQNLLAYESLIQE